MPQQIAEVSQQDWKDAFFEFGVKIYHKEIEAAFFAQRGVQALGRANFRLLRTDALLLAILDWNGEADAEGKVDKLHEFLENRGLIDTDGNIVRWKERPPIVPDSSRE